jgi:hypothetical protein
MPRNRWKILMLWSLIGLCAILVIWNTARLGFFQSARWNTPLFLAIAVCNLVRRRLSKST